MRAWSYVVGALILGGCSVLGDSHAANERPDATVPDAPTPPPYMPPTSCQLAVVTSVSRCTGSTASVRITNAYMGAGSHSMCVSTLRDETVQCTAGCAVEGERTRSGTSVSFFEYLYGWHARLLCAETPVAVVGQPCTTTGGIEACLPTRAVVDTNGLVTGQDYLTCDSSTHLCKAAGPPTIVDYLQPCDATLVAMYAAPGVNGVAGGLETACMIAWDETAQQARSGRTQQCLGDWECPSGALCDDGLDRLPSTNPVLGVCKPGPRGVLTPAMLSP